MPDLQINTFFPSLVALGQREAIHTNQPGGGDKAQIWEMLSVIMFTDCTVRPWFNLLYLVNLVLVEINTALVTLRSWEERCGCCPVRGKPRPTTRSQLVTSQVGRESNQPNSKGHRPLGRKFTLTGSPMAKLTRKGAPTIRERTQGKAEPTCNLTCQCWKAGALDTEELQSCPGLLSYGISLCVRVNRQGRTR